MNNSIKAFTSLSPNDFDSFSKTILEEVKTVEGFLSLREIRFLALLAAFPTCEGLILEIGSYKGKSTIALAKGAKQTSSAKVVSVDPLNSDTLEILKPAEGESKTNCVEDFYLNLEKTGVKDLVEFHQMYSYELASTWKDTIRLLWIDGDHSYACTKQDFELFSPYLADGAIVAYHDILYSRDHCIEAFIEDVVLSKHFGGIGFCGSIGWGQYFQSPEKFDEYKTSKHKIYNQLAKLLPFNWFYDELDRWQKWKYNFYRSMIPHKDLSPNQWLQSVEIMNSKLT